MTPAPRARIGPGGVTIYIYNISYIFLPIFGNGYPSNIQMSCRLSLIVSITPANIISFSLSYFKSVLTSYIHSIRENHIDKSVWQHQ